MEPEYVAIGTAAEAEAFAKQRGPWIVASIEQTVGWTDKPVTVEFGGKTLLLLPEDEKCLPAIALREDYSKDSRKFIMEFISALCWGSRGSVRVESWSGSGHLTRTLKGRTFGQIKASTFKVDYLPRPTDDRAKLALALYHEGASLQHVHIPYSFLSFYKIVNLVSGIRGAPQEEWIRAHAGQLTDHRAKERLKELATQGVEIGNYIYNSCRCAIAHAGDPRNPIIDPHNVDDLHRLSADLPIVIGLAEVALERELGVKTSQTVYKEHKYQLSGFDKFFTQEQLDDLRAGNTPRDTKRPDLPDLTIKLWGKNPYNFLVAMPSSILAMENGAVLIECISRTGRCIGLLALDFKEETIEFQLTWIEKDDGSAAFAVDYIASEQFTFDWNCNGCLEVWDDKCLSRSDAFIPVNMMVNFDGFRTGMAQLQDILAQRRASEANGGEAANSPPQEV